MSKRGRGKIGVRQLVRRLRGAERGDGKGNLNGGDVLCDRVDSQIFPRRVGLEVRIAHSWEILCFPDDRRGIQEYSKGETKRVALRYSKGENNAERRMI